MPELPQLPPTIAELAAFLAHRLPGSAEDPEVPLRFHVPPNAEGKLVRRLVFALDNRALVEGGDYGDALFLHRPFDLPTNLPLDLPLFAAHRAFDTQFGFGYNPALAETLELTDLLPLFRTRPHRADERVGMVGTVTEPCPQEAYLARLVREFGGGESESRADPMPVVNRVAVGAMTPELIAQAADAGVQIYITGQFRENSRSAAVRAGITVAAVGHRRSELWGLRRLARDCVRAFPGLHTEIREWPAAAGTITL